MTLIIKERVCLKPNHLDKNMYQHLLDKIKDKYEMKCNKEYGYIIKVNSIKKIHKTQISAANSDIVCTVDFDCDTLLPDVGLILEGIVCMIIDKGIFINVKDMLKVLITSNSLKDYEYEATSNYYFKKSKKIQKNDVCKFRITGVMYSKHNFSCLGELI
jgi:DNA-directed RNA polymerase subunit E'/Rpb7